MDNKRNLPEDLDNTVKYELYLSNPPDEQLINLYKKQATTIINGDIHEFNLKRHANLNLCYGSVKFKQNIEQEWLIVYILYELSKFDRDLVIKVQDTDGDILLIEAAEHLPPWLESSKSKNRVFIHKGELHIIPSYINLKDLRCNYKTSITDTQVAVQFIRDINRTDNSNIMSGHTSQNDFVSSKVTTLADPTIQDAIKEQLSGLPDKKAWLSKKFQQLDEIIYNNNDQHSQKKFKESLSLASVMAMDDEDLRISPISSVSSSFASSSSSSWLTEQEDD